MATPRDASYIWVTWITGLLAGNSYCEWAAWYRAHYSGYDKRPTDLDLATWKAQHSEMVRTRAIALKKEGYDVYIEQQNKFSLKGRAATLGGVPDLVAIRGAESLVIDCKTGQQRDSDYFQILTYMLVLPVTHPACRRRALAGELQYRHTSLCIEPQQLTDEVKTLIRTMIERVAGNRPLPKVPSSHECRFCDIGRNDCPERIDSEPPRIVEEHRLF